MKVCLLNDSFPPVIDGVANVVQNYAGIMQREHLADVMVGTPGYPGADYDSYPYQVVPYKSFDTTKFINGYRAGNPFVIKELKELTEFAPDIIHSHCPVSSTVLARMLRAKVDAPLIFTYHTKFDIDIAKAVKAKFIQKETIKALVNNIEACDEIWVVSHGAGENLRSLGFQGDYRVVNNGVDFPKGKATLEMVREVTEGYDLPEGVPVFLFVGRIVKYKGLPLILDALAKLEEAGQDFRMVFVGSGPDEHEVKDQARKLGLLRDGQDEEVSENCQPCAKIPSECHSVPGGKCIFTGPIHDREKLRAWNSRADLFLFPSTYDTNGIVVREAAACGLASVLIEGSCAAEGITHDYNGYMIEETADSMCELLKVVSKDIDHLHQVGDNAMKEIYISWEESVHAAVERYHEVIEMKKGGNLAVRKPMMTDRFLDFTVDLLDNTREMLEQPKRMFEGMRDNIEELKDSVEGLKGSVGGLKGSVGGFKESVDGLKDSIGEFTENVKEELKEEIHKLL